MQARHGGARGGRAQTVGALAAALAALLLQGCAFTQVLADATTGPAPRPAALDDEAPPIVRKAPAKGRAGGVFVAEAAASLTSDTRALRPGDLITVTLEETTQATKKADSSYGKGSNVAVSPTVIAGANLKTTVGIGAQRDFAGTSSSTQQNALQGSITVVVQEVLPNGLLRVRGEKSLFLNQGEEFVRVSGYVRAADIDTDNRISSQRIANARIAYAGQGAGADAGNSGWLMRFFNSPLMPF